MRGVNRPGLSTQLWYSCARPSGRHGSIEPSPFPHPAHPTDRLSHLWPGLRRGSGGGVQWVRVVVGRSGPEIHGLFGTVGPPAPESPLYSGRACRRPIWAAINPRAPPPPSWASAAGSSPASAAPAPKGRILKSISKLGQSRRGSVARSAGTVAGTGADILDKASAQVFSFVARWPTAMVRPRRAWSSASSLQMRPRSPRPRRDTATVSAAMLSPTTAIAERPPGGHHNEMADKAVNASKKAR